MGCVAATTIKIGDISICTGRRTSSRMDGSARPEKPRAGGGYRNNANLTLHFNTPSGAAEDNTSPLAATSPLATAGGCRQALPQLRGLRSW